MPGQKTLALLQRVREVVLSLPPGASREEKIAAVQAATGRSDRGASILISRAMRGVRQPVPDEVALARIQDVLEGEDADEDKLNDIAVIVWSTGRTIGMAELG